MLDNIEEKILEEEIKSLSEVGQIHGVFNKTEKDMIDIEIPLEKYLDKLLSEKYSRIPVYKDEVDNIIVKEL